MTALERTETFFRILLSSHPNASTILVLPFPPSTYPPEQFLKVKPTFKPSGATCLPKLLSKAQNF